MSRNNLPPNGGTPEQIASSALEDDKLAKIAQDIACPECGDLPIRVVGVVAPEDAEDETIAAFKTGLAGSLIGGILGAPLGPGGVALGMAGGGFAGSQTGAENAKKKRLVVECESCGYHGRAA